MQFNLHRNDRICVGSEALRFSKNEGKYLYFKNEQLASDQRVFGVEEFLELQTRRDYKFEQGYYSQEQVEARDVSLEKQLAALASPDAKSIMRKLSYAIAIETLYKEGKIVKTDKSLKENSALIQSCAITYAKRLCPKICIEEFNRYKSPRTLRAYLKKYEGGDYSLVKLADGRRRNIVRANYFCDDTERLMKKEIEKFANEDPPLPETIVRNTSIAFRDENKKRLEGGRKLLVIPSGSTIRRRLEKLNKFEVDCIRLGVDAARKKHAMAGVGLNIIAPLERVEIDEWYVDLYTFFKTLGLHQKLSKQELERIPKGRRWIAVAIDCATRVVLGLVIAENPSSEVSKQLLHQILTNKTKLANSVGAQMDWSQCGKPMVIAVDTGSAFVSDEFVRAATYLNIVIEFPPVATPELRGMIERFFKSLIDGLIPYLTGRTFSSVAEKSEYSHGDRTALTDSEFSEILINWIVDYYHVSSHAGLGGQLPINAWSEKIKEFGQSPALGCEQIAAALGIAKKCKLSKRGLRFFGLHYTCVELQEKYRSTTNREFDVRIMAENIGFMMVWIDDRWVRADCVEEHADGKHLEDWISEYRGITQKYRNDSEVFSDVRDAVMKRIGGKNDQGKERRQLVPSTMSAERLARLEQELYHGPTFVDVELEASNDPDVPYGQIISTDSSALGELPSEHVNAADDMKHGSDWFPSNDLRFKLEDE